MTDLFAEDVECGKVEAEGLDDDGPVQVPQLQHSVLHHKKIATSSQLLEDSLKWQCHEIFGFFIV